MPARKLKPVEANDGSYGGLVLATFDRMMGERRADECPVCGGVPADLCQGHAQHRAATVGCPYDLPDEIGHASIVAELGRRG